MINYNNIYLQNEHYHFLKKNINFFLNIKTEFYGLWVGILFGFLIGVNILW